MVCRLLSRSFKDSVDSYLRSLTHLRFSIARYEKEQEVCIPQRMSYFRDQFCNKAFCTYFTAGFSLMDGQKIFYFLGQFCPNLQVLQAQRYEIDYSSLLLLSQSLIYFESLLIRSHPNDLQLLTVSSDWTSHEDELYQLTTRNPNWLPLSRRLFKPFENLLAFDIYHDHHKSKIDITFFNSFIFADTLIRKNKPVTSLMITMHSWTGKSVDRTFCERLAECNLRCLRVEVQGPGQLLIPQSLADTLVDIIFIFRGTTDEFHPEDKKLFAGLFPKLNYLVIDIHRIGSWHFETSMTLLACAPQLRTFHFKGKMSFEVLEQAFDHISHLRELRSIYFCVTGSAGSGILSVQLPSRLQIFTLKYVRHKILNSQLNSLCSLDSSILSKFHFNSPNLRMIELTLVDQSYAELKSFLQRLPQLKSLRIWLRNKTQRTHSLVNLILKVPTLDQVQFGCEERKPLMGTLVIKQTLFPSVKSFRMFGIMRTQFYPLDIFESLEASPSNISFISQSTHFCFLNSNLIVAKTPLQKLRYVYLSWFDSTLVNLLVRCTQVTNVEITNFDIRTHQKLYNVFIQWLCSLRSLKTLTGHFEQEHLEHFLLRTKTAGPLKLKVTGDRCVLMKDRVHRLLERLISNNSVIT